MAVSSTLLLFCHLLGGSSIKKQAMHCGNSPEPIPHVSLWEPCSVVGVSFLPCGTAVSTCGDQTLWMYTSHLWANLPNRHALDYSEESKTDDLKCKITHKRKFSETYGFTYDLVAMQVASTSARNTGWIPIGCIHMLQNPLLIYFAMGCNWIL